MQRDSLLNAQTPLIDSALIDGPPLTPRFTDPSAFEPIVEHVRSCVPKDGRVIIEPDQRRDYLLADYRARFSEQVVHDLSYNLQHLWTWANRLDSNRTRSRAVLRDTQVRDGFRRLNVLRRFLIDSDAWSSNRAELECGLAFQQFYFDSLALGDCLWQVEHGTRMRRSGAQKLRRTEIPGAASYGFFQALMNAVEIGIPDILSIRPLRALLPAALYQGTRYALPWPRFRYAKWLSKVRYISVSGALASINSPGGAVVVRHGVDEFYADPDFFDQASGRTKHDIIVVFAHRHPTFDMAVLAETLDGKSHGVWGNVRYFPKSATHDPHVVVVEQAGKKPMADFLDKSVDILSHHRLPLVISVDGTIPYLCYGQQMRIKRGIRLLADYLKAQTVGSGRRTYIVPASFDDAVSFVRGLDSNIRVTFHQPICAQDIAPLPSPPDSSQVNWGDPLLNHLECLFLANSGQIRHGWRTPSVIDTVRRRHEKLSRDRTLRGWIRSCFHPSLFDLSREQDHLGHKPRKMGPWAATQNGQSS